MIRGNYNPSKEKFRYFYYGLYIFPVVVPLAGITAEARGQFCTHMSTQVLLSRKKKKEASRIASKCPKNLLNLAGPIGASQQVRSPSN